MVDGRWCSRCCGVSAIGKLLDCSEFETLEIRNDGKRAFQGAMDATLSSPRPAAWRVDFLPSSSTFVLPYKRARLTHKSLLIGFVVQVQDSGPWCCLSIQETGTLQSSLQRLSLVTAVKLCLVFRSAFDWKPVAP